VRAAVVLLALAFLAGFGFLTAYVLVTRGFDVLVGISIAILGVVGWGVLGALGTRPREP